jgi:hypothetical protein
VHASDLHGVAGDQHLVLVQIELRAVGIAEVRTADRRRRPRRSAIATVYHREEVGSEG